jgi:lipoic acid synthetase
MKLGHVVITSVARDDLPDGGADHFRRTIVAVRSLAPKTVIEVLTPDFRGSEPAIEKVLSARPEVFNHNIETVRRLTPRVRSKASYDRSLLVLSVAKAKAGEAVLTKSGLMLGLGETENELLDALGDLRKAGCRALTLGQYLQPSHKHLPVAEFIPPDKFTEYAQKAIEMGFSHVASAPLVRSSYHADQLAKTGHASVLAS